MNSTAAHATLFPVHIAARVAESFDGLFATIGAWRGGRYPLSGNDRRPAG